MAALEPVSGISIPNFTAPQSFRYLSVSQVSELLPFDARWHGASQRSSRPAARGIRRSVPASSQSVGI